MIVVVIDFPPFPPSIVNVVVIMNMIVVMIMIVVVNMIVNVVVVMDVIEGGISVKIEIV